MCSICLVDNPKYRNLTCCCGHQFHKKCINRWLKKNDSCPICREVIRDDVVPQHVMDELRAYVFRNRVALFLEGVRSVNSLLAVSHTL